MLEVFDVFFSRFWFVVFTVFVPQFFWKRFLLITFSGSSFLGWCNFCRWVCGGAQPSARFMGDDALRARMQTRLTGLGLGGKKLAVFGLEDSSFTTLQRIGHL